MGFRELSRVLGMDDIHDRLSLRQVDFPVEECAFGELAAPSKTRAGGEARLEHAARRYASAVTLELHRVLAGVGMRRLEHEEESAIGAAEVAEEESPRAGGRDLPPSHLASDFPRVGTAYAHHRNAAATGRARRRVRDLLKRESPVKRPRAMRCAFVIFPSVSKRVRQAPDSDHR